MSERVSYGISEPITSRLPEEDSSDMDSDSDNEVSQIDTDSQISTSIRSSKSAKVSQIDTDSQISTSIRSSKSAKEWSCLYLRQYTKTFPWATTLRKGSSFGFCMKCSRDISLGRDATRDLRRHQETKLHEHSGKGGVGILPLQSYFGPIREESVICAEVPFAYFLGEHHLAF